MKNSNPHYRNLKNFIICRFFAFSRKTKDIFRRYFWYIKERDLNNFFPKNANFRHIHQIKKWEYEPLGEHEWLRRIWQNFSTAFATFWSKNHHSKIVIWVLKRSVLMRKIHRRVRKMFWRQVGSPKWDIFTKIYQNIPNLAFFDK